MYAYYLFKKIENKGGRQGGKEAGRETDRHREEFSIHSGTGQKAAVAGDWSKLKP